MNKKIIMWIVVFFMVSSFASALGVLPAKQSINAEVLPTNFAGSFKVVNNQQIFMNVKVYAIGPLASYITIEEEELSFTPNDKFKEVYFSLSLDASAPPGLLETKIIVEEDLEGILFENNIGSRLMMFHKLIVQTPYPGKYVDAVVDFSDTPSGYEIETTVRNLGRESISDLQATHRVLDESKRLFTLRSLKEQLQIAASTTLTTNLGKNSLKKGQYNLLTLVEFDKELLEVNNPLFIGEPIVKLVDFDDTITAGQINRISFPLSIDWNVPIENATATIELLREGRTVEELSTKPATLYPKKLSRLEAYLDATELEEGEYSLFVTFNYLDFSSSETIPITINKEKRGSSRGSSDSLLYFVVFLSATVTITIILVLLQFYKRPESPDHKKN